MRKVFAVFFLTVFLLSISSFVFGVCEYGDPPKTCEDCPVPGGLVPCGRNCDDPTTSKCECEPCRLCDFFVMIDIWIKGLFFMVVPPLAVLMIAIGGWMYFLSQGNPEKIAQAKKLFTAVAFGLLIVYGSWLIVNTFLMTIGVAEWTGLKECWWIISCD